jgi:CheY-like chemotaxis protein
MKMGQGGQQCTVLIVDDDDWTRNLLEKLLQALELRTLTAGDGQQALEVYSHQRDYIDLVVTDVVMPEMDGLTLARKLVDIDPRIKIIVVSGTAREEEQQGALPTGVFRWLRKPIDLSELKATVHEALPQPRASE